MAILTHCSNSVNRALKYVGKALLILVFCGFAAQAWAADLEGAPPAPQTSTNSVHLPVANPFSFGHSKLGLPIRMTGSMSLNWRNVGPRQPGFETQIQNEVYLADMYFGFEGPVFDNVPFAMEFQFPTGGQGQPNLYRLDFHYHGFERWDIEAGKFLVPFGRYNELYRPDMFLTVTRPLLYATPDSLDLVVRLNSPRPPFSSGYTDIGGRATFYPVSSYWFMPSEATVFVINGLGEESNRSRTFPTPNNLGIPPPPANGSTIDFGHENNNLADNNNNKTVGGRVVFSLGTIDLPWPIPEGKRDVDGVTMGLSGMGGQYDLEAQENYQMYGFDLTWEYQGFNFSSEYEYSYTEFKSPLEVSPSSKTIQTPAYFIKDFEINQGYFIQASYPIIRKPRWGKRVTGAVVYNQLFRRGPSLDLLLNQAVNGTVSPSIAAINTTTPRVSTRMDKFTAAMDYQLSDHFTFKYDFSYWSLVRSSTLHDVKDIYQNAFSLVLSF